MANRFMSTAELEGAVIWYSPSKNYWWMESTDAYKAACKVEQFPDAIHVTNAYEVLDPDFVHKLMTLDER